MRRQAFARDKGICARCQVDCEKMRRVYLLIMDSDAQWFYGDLVRFNDKVFWEADHIQERADGGADCLENIQTLCRPCHLSKTANSQRARQTPALRQAFACLREVYDRQRKAADRRIGLSWAWSSDGGLMVYAGYGIAAHALLNAVKGVCVTTEFQEMH